MNTYTIKTDNLSSLDIQIAFSYFEKLGLHLSFENNPRDFIGKKGFFSNFNPLCSERSMVVFIEHGEFEGLDIEQSHSLNELAIAADSTH